MACAWGGIKCIVIHHAQTVGLVVEISCASTCANHNLGGSDVVYGTLVEQYVFVKIVYSRTVNTRE